MKCGFGTMTHSKSAGKKKRGKDLLFMQPIGNITFPQGKGSIDQSTYIQRTTVIQKKYKQFFSFYISHNWSSEESSVQNEKKTHVKLLEK